MSVVAALTAGIVQKLLVLADIDGFHYELRLPIWLFCHILDDYVFKKVYKLKIFEMARLTGLI